MRRSIPNRFALFILLLALIGLPLKSVLAHGGEDHGEKKAVAAPAGAGMTARVVRVGDYEVTIKHPHVEPDREATARVFVTRFATNEPVGDAKITVVVEDTGGAPAEVVATSLSTPGIYEVKLPPMRQGECRLSARVDVGGQSMTANYGAMMVSMPEAAANSGVSLWARTALIVFALLVVLGLLAAAIIYFVLPHFRRNRIKGEALTT